MLLIFEVIITTFRLLCLLIFFRHFFNPGNLILFLCNYLFIYLANERVDKSTIKAIHINRHWNPWHRLESNYMQIYHQQMARAMDGSHKINSKKSPPPTHPLEDGYRRIKREEVVLARLHIGHTHLTHLFLLKNEEPSHYVQHTKNHITIKQILIGCTDFNNIHKKFYVKK